MKYIFISLLIALYLPTFSQKSQIGITREQVINSMNVEPCKSSYNELWFCGLNGFMVNYGFDGGQVKSIMSMTEFNSKYLADIDVKNKIIEFTNQYGKPTMKDEKAFWFVGDELNSLFYGYSNGKHYSCFGISKR